MWGSFWLVPGGLPFAESVSSGEQFLSQVLEPGVTVGDALRLILAESAGDLTISGTTYTLKSVGGSVDRIVATVDASGRDVTATNAG